VPNNKQHLSPLVNTKIRKTALEKPIRKNFVGSPISCPWLKNITLNWCYIQRFNRDQCTSFLSKIWSSKFNSNMWFLNCLEKSWHQLWNFNFVLRWDFLSISCLTNLPQIIFPDQKCQWDKFAWVFFFKKKEKLWGMSEKLFGKLFVCNQLKIKSK
jgi:hypothetical protein